jgi:glycogen phosphorylase
VATLTPPGSFVHQFRTKPKARAAYSAEVEEFRASLLGKLTYVLGKDRQSARERDWFIATALTVRDRIAEHWLASDRRADQQQKKRVYYLSIEYLIGRLLFDTLTNLDLTEAMRIALASFEIDLDQLRALEADAGLGTGGLGRLAACYLDSTASLGVPTYGYGIRYEYGLFRQQLAHGWQNEVPDDWLANGDPWEFARSDLVYPIRFGGMVEYVGGDGDTARAIWYPAETIDAAAYDTPVVGWRGRHVNTLRLWSARARDSMKLAAFNEGDFVGAIAARSTAEAISRVLYPSDETPAGRELRLRQEYFFTSASLQDIVRRHIEQHGGLESLPDKAAIQLNETHAAIGVAELMRILVDEHEFSWKDAWRICTATLNYTNHTLLPEALESWPVSLLGRLLPRHMQIIYLINWLHLKEMSERGEADPAVLASLSLIEEGREKSVRMGHLAFLGSRKINGVSALHSELMRNTVFRDLEAASPGKIVNVTNGITFRRWLLQANPGLTSLLVDALGERVREHPKLLPGLDRFAGDASFVARYREVRRQNKVALAKRVQELTGIVVDPMALFDVHVKRIHEYKRQLLNLLEAIALFNAIRAQPDANWTPRVKLFAGKAAANYARAKLIIKLAHDVARVVNADEKVAGRLKIAFLPNYSVSLAEAIVPAADLSEQISTAGMEASGTGNMKLALNGALTIGTLDGANIEMLERIGPDSLFIFGLTATEVEAKRRMRFAGREAAHTSPELRGAIEAIASGRFSPEEPDRFLPIVHGLLDYDYFMVGADFEAYWRTQRAIDALWQQPAAWWQASIHSTAHMGWFSADRAIRTYAEEIWGVRPEP